ncbi:pyrroloquinoline quinone precursor peptide PqqA [Streptomyces sp. NPDC015127]|uniref:pyrroloquinoline quinone precursor peptide PqqA n=1 Tax=Streptomyces sp. NPDC015127 TaxID=3364939 RepID=UPI0036F970BE
MPPTPVLSRTPLTPPAHEVPPRDSAPPARPQPADSWRTPDFTVVETALEVTAYALADR